MRAVALTAFALTLFGAPAAIAQSPQKAHPRPVEVSRSHKPDEKAVWMKGKRLSAAQRKHGIDHKRLHLQAPGKGQQWVELDNQYLLVNIGTGLIAAVIAGR